MLDRLHKPRSLGSLVLLAALTPAAEAQLGTTYCSSAPSSNGATAELTATGSLDPARNDLSLRVDSLPQHSFGVLLVGRERGRIALAGPTAGTLCVAPGCGAFPVFAQVAGGSLDLIVDLTVVPSIGGPFAVERGDSLQFQYWFRDMGPVGATSSLSSALCLTFAPGPWFGGQVFALEGVPSEHTLGDVDGDGALDAVVLNRAIAEVTIARGHGDGTFGAGRRYPMAPTPSGLELADVDGDGDLDLLHSSALAPGMPRSPALLVNQGGGVFAAPTLLPYPPDLERFEVGDLDGDGDDDLVALGAAGAAHHILWNNGAGGFALGPTLDAGFGSAGAALGDLDGDGDLDLVNATGSEVRVLLCSGAGNFVASADLPMAQLAGEPLLVDLDRDGDLDLVAVDLGPSGALIVRLGRGDGTFDAPARSLTGAPPLRLATGDLDGDGLEDLLVSHAGDALVLVGNGAGGLGDGATLPLGGARHALGDLDGDGLLDLTSLQATRLEVHLNRGAQDLSFGHALDVPATPAVRLRAGDLDGDGHVELVYPHTGPTGGIVILEGAGTWAAPIQSLALPGTALREIWVGDLDGDGRDDVAGHDWGSASFQVHLNGGAGQFASTPPQPVVPVAWVEAADLDGDGDLDFVLPSATTPELSVVQNLGAGAFAPEVRFATGVPSHEVSLADVDGDGSADLLTLNSAVDRFSVFRGDGLGGFGPATSFASQPDAWYFALGDLDGDADVDLVEAAGASVRLHRNRGDGTFEPSTMVPTAGVVYGLAVTDVDLDGDLDLVLLHSLEHQFATLLNRGDGRTFEERRHALQGTPYWLARATPDLEHDEDPDLLVYIGGGRLLVLLNELR